jgi:hypothetical protein
MLLSKSDYMLFLKQPAWLWLKNNDPKILPAVDANTQALFDAGHQFEPYAESLFPEGVALGFSDYNEYLSLPQRTQNAIEDGAPVLFQPRFEWKNFTCICDIVFFVGDNEVDLYEIKASTSSKTEHEFDLAFQTEVLEGTGLKVRSNYVIHVNNKYIRNGAIEADKITYIEVVTDRVRKRSEVTKKNMTLALAVATQETMPDPSPDLAKLGSKKSWLQVYEIIIPQPQKKHTIDIAPTIQQDEINKFLVNLQYPLYFLDYETMTGLIPYFDGHRPYQQVPFQYSLHVIREIGAEAEVEHREFLHRENSDPSQLLAEHLIKDIGTIGTVLVWYEKFEKSRNSELGVMLPEHKDAMEAINDRIIDLMLPFKNKWYYDPRFEGSASIKKVLPVLYPELSYKNLGIQEGGTAQRLWMEAILDNKRESEKEKILSDLTEYCALDTMAMVEIYKKLLTIHENQYCSHTYP